MRFKGWNPSAPVLFYVLSCDVILHHVKAFFYAAYERFLVLSVFILHHRILPENDVK